MSIQTAILFLLTLSLSWWVSPSESSSSIIFFESDDIPSLLLPPVTTVAPEDSRCMRVEDCPHLLRQNNEELSRIRPCRFEDNVALYPCIEPPSQEEEEEGSTSLTRSSSSTSTPTGQPLGSACSDCRLGVDCPATKALLDAKDFVTLKAGFTLCGFSGRNPKFCCPPPHDLGTLRNAASGEEDYDYDGDYQLRDINIQGSVKSDNNPRESLFTNDRCGYSEPTRIRHGNDAGTHEHPWNVALLYKNASMNGRVLCGGVLLSETEALTAAHCVRDFKGFLLTSILVGHAEIGQAMEVNLTGVTLHPSYTRAPLIINDIAILHFDPLQLDSEKIKIICLPLKGSFSREDESGVVSGWGVTEESLFSENLQRLDVELVSSEKCEEDYQGKQSSFSLESSQICASGLKEDSDSCSGDSGSPLLYYEPLEGRAVLLGITSFGTRKCDSSVPGVYTRVESFLPWMGRAISHARSVLASNPQDGGR